MPSFALPLMGLNASPSSDGSVAFHAPDGVVEDTMPTDTGDTGEALKNTTTILAKCCSCYCNGLEAHFESAGRIGVQLKH